MKECPKCHHCYDDSVISCEFDNTNLITTLHGNVIISGRYILEERLGNGGLGVVFRAKHKFLKSQYAIKIILPSLVEQDSNLLLRFKQEAVLAASIDHPNVVRVTDFGVEDEIMPYLVMEYVNGTPLSDFLKPDVPLTLRETLDFFQPIALGVAEAHRQGIVHRDLKPQNIMVQKNMPLKKGVKVLDFGLAKIKSSESFGSFVQTQANNILGSPPYMSPEQWENNQVDTRADIYGLGVILYQMLTGNLPFQADSIPSVMYQHLTVEPPAFATHGVNLAPEIENVVRWCLQKDRALRPATVEAMLSAFEGAVVDAGLTDFALSTMTPNTTSDAIGNETDQNDNSMKMTLQLTNSQREKLSSYFDSQADVSFSANEKLAHEFLDAKDRAEEAKEQANQADRLVNELAEAQKDAEVAQQKALDAKQRIEAEVRKRLEAEMENKLALEQQERQIAEAERLSQEIEARKKAEERANYLAQAALEAQRIAEIERKKNEVEVHQREVNESARRETENQAQQLAQQVAEAKKQFEEAKKLAEYEARLRRIAEEKQDKIEVEILSIAEKEAERRKIIEAQAQQHIEEQASRFEKEADEARKRVEEARLLADFESKKREQAEASQKRAEEEARRLADEIMLVQKQMREIENSNAPHSQSGNISHSASSYSGLSSNSEQLTAPIINFQDKTTPNIPLNLSQSTLEIQSPASNPNYSGFLNTNPSAAKRPSMMIIAGAFALLLISIAGGLGLYFFMRPSPNIPPLANNNSNVNSSQPTTNASKGEMILIQGGTFQMGRSDIPDKNDLLWGNQYPAHPVNVPSFKISKTEITNEEYAEFVKDARHSAPADWTNGKPPQGQEKFPVTNVSLADAKAYADWVSKRNNNQCSLPTEEQWEFAARNGSRQTSYPWGDDWRADAANVATDKKTDVGISTDETTAGVKDMLGGVIEWTSTKYALYQNNGGVLADKRELYVARGSSFGESKNLLTNSSWFTTRRRTVPAEEKSTYLGFRLACQP